SSGTLTVPLGNLLDNPTGAPRDLATSAVPSDAWLHSITITGANGHPIEANSGNFGVLRDYCPNLQPDATRNGVLNPAACAAWLGHANAAFTMRTYVHSQDDELAEAARRLQQSVTQR